MTSREVRLHLDASLRNVSFEVTLKLIFYKQDQRSRLSKLWAPSGGIAISVDEGVLDSISKEMTQFTESLV